MRKILLAVCLLTGLALAQAPSTVTGIVYDAGGNVATSGYVKFDISPKSSGVQYFVSGVGVIGTPSVSCPITAGSISCRVWGNSFISPANTCYMVTLVPNGVTTSTTSQLVGTTTYSINSPAFCPQVSITPQQQSYTGAPASANITPIASHVFNLGSPSSMWASVYADTLHVTSFVDPLFAASQPTPVGVAGWGDSYVSANEGNGDQGSWLLKLQQLLGYGVVNQGLGGQTSTQVAVRMGAVATNFATVSGGVIPACPTLPCSSVTVTFPSGKQPIVTQGSPAVSYNFVTGTVQTTPAIHGTVTLNGTYSFTPDEINLGATVSGTPTFTLDTPYSDYLPVIWEGRNDILTTGCSTIQSNLVAQMAGKSAGVIMSIPNKNTATEFSGQANYNTIVNCNALTAAAFPDYYLDIRSILVAAYNPLIATDVTDHSRDMPPTSLRALQGTFTLSGGIGSTDTDCSISGIPFTVSTGAMAGNGFILVVDNEGILVNTVIGSSITSCQRGYSGTLAAHLNGTAMSEYDPNHYSVYGDEVIAQAVAAKVKTLPAYVVGQTGLLGAAGGMVQDFKAFDYSNTAAGHGVMRYTTGPGNTGVGYLAMDYNTTGNENVAVGANALGVNTVGNRNVAIGFHSLFSSVTAGANVAVGPFAMSATTSSNNTCVGYLCMAALTTGTSNVGIGYQALDALVGGNSNSGGGYNVLSSLTSGSGNTAFGYGASQTLSTHTNTTAFGTLALSNNDVDESTAFGSGALASNTSGTGNSAGGFNALNTNSTASNNTAFGYSALKASNSTGSTAMGTNALLRLTSGTGSSAFGNAALAAVTTANDNTGLGASALTLTTGASNTGVGSSVLATNSTGAGNTGVGHLALEKNDTGSFNVAVGRAAVQNVTNSSKNTGLGYFALNQVTTTPDNTAVGFQAGYNLGTPLQTITQSTFVGSTATSTTDALTNMTVIGYGAQGTASNQVTLGNASVTATTLRGAVTAANFISTVATGTSPIAVTSTTPIVNLNATPITYNKSGTQQTATHIVQDTCTLGTSCSVTLSGSAVFTNSTSYTCVAEDNTAAAATKVAQSSGSAFAITGTGTDVLRYICVGN